MSAKGVLVTQIGGSQLQTLSRHTGGAFLPELVKSLSRVGNSTLLTSERCEGRSEKPTTVGD